MALLRNVKPEFVLLEQILLDIPDKLAAASSQLAKHTVNTLFTLVPIILCNVITMNRTDLYRNIGKSHLLQHQAAPGMKCFADDQSGFDLDPFFVRNLSGEKSVVTGMP